MNSPAAHTDSTAALNDSTFDQIIFAMGTVKRARDAYSAGPFPADQRAAHRASCDSVLTDLMELANKPYDTWTGDDEQKLARTTKAMGDIRSETATAPITAAQRDVFGTLRGTPPTSNDGGQTSAEVAKAPTVDLREDSGEPETRAETPWYRKLRIGGHRSTTDVAPQLPKPNQVAVTARPYAGLCGARTSRGGFCGNLAGSCPHH